MEGFAYLIALVISIVLIIAQLRLFSIDASLKAILAELKFAAPKPAAQASISPVELETQRAKIAEVQNNWPGYK
jgi:hypothetical protein